MNVEYNETSLRTPISEINELRTTISSQSICSFRKSVVVIDVIYLIDI